MTQRKKQRTGAAKSGGRNPRTKPPSEGSDSGRFCPDDSAGSTSRSRDVERERYPDERSGAEDVERSTPDRNEERGTRVRYQDLPERETS